MRQIEHFVDGRAFAGVGKRFGDVFDPNTGEVQAQRDAGRRRPISTPRCRPPPTAQVGWARDQSRSAGRG